MNKVNRLSGWEKVLFLMIIMFFVLRLFRVLDYPAEFSIDELREIEDSVLRYLGVYGFFHYADYTGASGNLFFQITSLIVPLVRENIELYRIIAVFINGLFIAGAALLVNMYFGRRAAVYALFSGAVLISGFAMSRIYLSNNLVPLLMIYSVFFLERAMRGSKAGYVFFGIVFIAGFNTYINWMFIIPVLIYVGFVRHKEGIIERKTFRNIVYFIVAVSGIAYTLILSESYILKHVIGEIVAAKGGMPGKPDDYAKLFIGGMQNTAFFPLYWPFFSYAETILMIGGVVFLLKEKRGSSQKILIFISAFFLLSVFVTGAAHLYRANHLIIPFVLIMAFMLNKLDEKKSKFLIPASCILAATSLVFIFYYFAEYERQAIRDTMNKRIAGYLNKQYGGEVRYFEGFDDENYRMASLRIRGYYRKGMRPAYTAFKINDFWLKEAIEDIRKREENVSFTRYSSALKGSYTMFPAAVIVLPADSAFSGRMAANNEKIVKLKSLKKAFLPGEWAEEAMGYYSEEKEDILYNTYLKELIARDYLGKGLPNEAINVYLNEKRVAYMPPDFYLKAARCYRLLGDSGKYNYYMEKFQSLLKE